MNAMTLEERQKNFIEEYNILVKRYGIQVGANVASETLGEVVQIRAQMSLVAVTDWKPSESPPQSSE